MSDYTGLSVINLSDVTLSEPQTMALSKGLTFCPTPKEPDMADIMSNFDKFFRKMKLKAHFHRIETKCSRSGIPS